EADPTPATTGGNQTLCGVTSTTLTGNDVSAGVGTGAWSIVSGAGGSFVNNALFNTVFNGVAGNSYVLRWTVSNGTCTPSSADMTVTFDQNPTTANAGSDQTLCGTSTSLAGNVPTIGTGQWSFAPGGNTDGFGAITDVNSATSGFTGTAGVSYILRWTISNGVCSPSSNDVTINLEADPTPATTGGNQTLCGVTSTTLTGNDVSAGVGTGAWSIVSGAGGSFVNNALFNTVFNGVAGNSYVLRWTVSNGTCTPSSADMTVTFDQNPTTANAGPDQYICDNNTLLNANIPAIGVGQWSFINTDGLGIISDINSASTNFTGSYGFNYILRWTTSNGVCPNSTDDVNIEFDQIPIAAVSPGTQTICHNTSTNISLSELVGVSGLITYDWTVVYSGVSGPTNSGQELSTDIGGPVISEILTNTGNAPGTATYTIVATSAAPFNCASTSIDVVVTVMPEPTALAADETICSGNTTNIPITDPTGVAGTTFSWTILSNTNVSGASAGSGALIAQALTSADNVSTGSVTYEITPNANSCDGPTSTVTVTVNPVPVITNTPLELIQTYCSGTTLNFTPNSSVAGTTFSWTSSITGTIDGASVTASGSGTINDTPINNGNSLATVIYTITPSYLGCQGIPVNFIAFVRPTPDVAASDQTICSGELSNIAITNPNGVSNTSFDWVVSNITGAITGASDGSGSLISQALVNSSAVAGSVTYTITPSAFACNGSPLDVTVTVNPLPTVSAGVDLAICEGENAMLNGTIGGAATIATWTSSDGLGTFSPNNNDLNATFIPDASQVGSTITLTLTTDDPSGPCVAVQSSIALTINALPVLSFGGLNPEYAVNEPTVPLFGSPTGGTFVGPGIVSGLSFSPFEAGVGTHMIRYDYTDPITLCSNSSAPQMVVVNPLPDVGIPGLGATDFCFDDPDFQLIGDPVANNVTTFGVFSGPGVVNNEFFRPSLAGVGTHVIRYTFTDENNATNFTDVVVNVRDLPVSDFTVLNSCDGEVVAFNDMSSIPNPSSIVAWEWDFGDNSPIDNSQNPNHLYAAPGTYTITLTVESNFGCRSSKSADLEIGAFPITKFSWDRICYGDVTRFTDNTFFSSGTISSYSWDFGDPASGANNTSAQQNPTHVFSGPGTYDVTLTVTTGIGCMRSITEQVFILPAIGANDYPYSENFEAGAAGWVAEGPNNSWEWGTPDGSMVINSAASGSYAWVTNLTGSYNTGERSWVNTPCFDFSTMEKPMIAFKIWSHTEKQKSGVIVECSTDGGDTWTVLGDDSGIESVEWYNTSAIIGSPSSPGNVNIGDLGWSGKETGWVEVKHSLDRFRGYSSVRFRITFGADLNDPSISGLNGFAFDDFYIGERSKVILLEHFTNNSQAESGLSNDQVTSLVTQNSNEVFNINYHTSFPGFDLFNQENKPDPSARRLFYGLSEPPNSVFNGEHIFTLLNASNTAVLQDSIDKLSLETPLFDINLTLPATSNSQLDIDAVITATPVIPPGFNEELVVHTAIIETDVSGVEGIPAGITYYNVMKKLLPDASGNTINRTWNVNDTETVSESWTVQRAYDPTKLAVIVFVQNKNTKRVYQAAYLKAPDKQNVTVTGIDDGNGAFEDLIIYPQPASDHITLALSKSLQNRYTWKITDLRGVTVKNGSIERHEKGIDITTDTLTSGMYYIILEADDEEIIRRKILIVQ
ncbi:PKD domain-containing protein, partial [Fulvivirgaceae bacterium BMA12]|nr:PKD domain-containing protein [Fulvivirgaceae bacterium BMA12]